MQQDIQPGDDVRYNGYPIGTLKSILTDITNGCQIGLVEIHDRADDAPTPIPMNELKRDVRHTEAAL